MKTFLHIKFKLLREIKKEQYTIERKNSDPKIEMTLLIAHEFSFFQ